MKKKYSLLLLTGLFCLSFNSGIQAQNFTAKKEKIDGLSIFPNPANGSVLHISSSRNLTKTVSVFTVLGERVLFKVLVDTDLNISALPPAVYVIRIKEGNHTSTRKLVRG